MTTTTQLGTYPDGTIIQIGARRFALQAWDQADQRCEDEIVYSGFTRLDWKLTADPSAIVVERADGWRCSTGDYAPQLHDDGGVRVFGEWHRGKARIVGSAYDLWEK